jgi:hypothetical protein
MGLVVLLTSFGLEPPMEIEMVSALLLQARPGINSVLLHRLLHRLDARVGNAPTPIVILTPLGELPGVSRPLFC